MSDNLAGAGLSLVDYRAEDAGAISKFLRKSWHDTYLSDEHGITSEMIDDIFDRLDSDEAQQKQETEMQEWLVKPDEFYSKNIRDSVGKVAGLINCQKRESDQEIHSFYIDKPLQGSGIARELFQQLLEWFDDDKPIVLWAADYNQRARTFYQRLGFEVVPGQSKESGELPQMTIIKMKRKPDKEVKHEI